MRISRLESGRARKPNPGQDFFFLRRYFRLQFFTRVLTLRYPHINLQQKLLSKLPRNIA